MEPIIATVLAKVKEISADQRSLKVRQIESKNVFIRTM